MKNLACLGGIFLFFSSFLVVTSRNGVMYVTNLWSYTIKKRNTWR